jgi:hypothetical protein
MPWSPSRLRRVPTGTAARLPAEADPLDDEPRETAALLSRFRHLLDVRHQVEPATRVVARYLRLGHLVRPLFDTLAWATVREDVGFHTFQMLEAGLCQYEEWGGGPECEQVLFAVARYLAAHAPTDRAQLQTADIALRLHRGDSLYADDAAEAVDADSHPARAG